jgi:hypothetical protein
MTGFPDSPRILKGGIVLLDATTGVVQRIITLQYNPDTLTRTLQAQSVAGADSTDHSDIFRLKGPAVETFKIDAEIDATDQLEANNATFVQVGIAAQLAAMEMMLYPSTATLIANNALNDSGVLEILPMESPLTLFVWSANRIVPVRITEFSITEDAFDTALNPIRAKVSLGFRVLSVTDLGFNNRGGSIYLAYQRAKEQLAARATPGDLSRLGIGGIP